MCNDRDEWKHGMIKTIFLDLDGVLCDFVSPLLAMFGKTHDQVFPPGVPGSYEFHGPLGISRNLLWRTIDELGEEHWSELDAYPWAGELVELCQSRAKTIILTSPSLHHSSAAGKVRWLQRQFGRSFRDYLIGSCKEECARGDAVLIDDYERNTKKFVERGGNSILFPRPWNENWQQADTPLITTKLKLDAICEVVI